MHIRWSILRILAIILLLPVLAYAQISGNLIFEHQRGNIPQTEPTDLGTYYGQLNLNMYKNNLQAMARVESFSSPDQTRSFHKISQYRLQYRFKSFELQAGYFYDIIGRGLLLRAYEIPGSIFEGSAYRVRYGFYRDIEGVRLKYRTSRFDVKLLYGRPLINVLPPTLDGQVRREDQVEAIEAHYRVLNMTLGAAYLHLQNEGFKGDILSRDYASFSISSPLFGGLDLYSEFAQEIEEGKLSFCLKNNRPFAFYSSLNYSKLKFGMSLEYKRYNDFFLGSGFNDPPPLIKEHSYAVLNRSTHLLNPFNESGVQWESFVQLHENVRLTGNLTYAKNDLASLFEYWESFLELDLTIGSTHHATFFVDFAQDDLKGEEDRFSTGFEWEETLPHRFSATLTGEYQIYEPTCFEEDRVSNYVAQVAISQASKWTVALRFEASTDPFKTDDIRTPEVETAIRRWFGVSTTLKPNHRYLFSLFAGQRRGGPACTSGICYEVLDFKGIELRFTTRF
jgi:hypothetical protein